MDWCRLDGHENTAFVTADATDTGLPRNHFDVVYCRFLLLHLTDPDACLQEMWRVLKPGGIVVVEDGDLATAGSVPPTALDAFANLFRRLAPIRGVDYSLSNRLCQMVVDAGFSDISLKVHQPADRDGNMGLLMKWTAEEAGPAFVGAGLVAPDDLEWLLAEMERAANNPDVLAIGPRMSLVTGRKLVN